ncbi:MAG: hypothetical protein NVS3B20_11300 [Polyangiales bacterium]
MCFSAEASFGAATVLSFVGAIAIKGARRREQLPFAAIPLIFAAHQAVEGMLWIVLSHSPYWKSSHALVYAFLFFALALWPFYIPFSLWFMEPSGRRRTVLAGLSIAGFLIGAYLLACTVMRPVYSCVAAQHIYYYFQIDAPVRQAVIAAYVVVILCPWALSSVRGTLPFGLLAIASFVVAGYLFRTGFASVWCFFAAILSLFVAAIVSRKPRFGTMISPRSPPIHARPAPL